MKDNKDFIDYPSRLIASSTKEQQESLVKVDIPKICAYIRGERKKGRKNEDITLEEVKQFIID